MKTIYFFKRLTAVIAMLLMAMNVFSQTTAVGTPVLVPNATTTPNTLVTYEVPVTVTGFPDARTISLILTYDKKILTYLKATLNPGLISAGMPQIAPDGNGNITLTYSNNATAINLGGTGTQELFRVTFTTDANTQGLITPLAWTSAKCEYADQTGKVITSPSPVFTDGYIRFETLPHIKWPTRLDGQPFTLSTVPSVTLDFSCETGMVGYQWAVSDGSSIVNSDGSSIVNNGTNAVKITFLNPLGVKTVSVSFSSPQTGGPVTTSYTLNYYPFADAIDPYSIPQFVDPLPHFAAGARINAFVTNDLTIKTEAHQQIGLSTGTHLATGIIGDPAKPDAGKGWYATYKISKDGGKNWGLPMWPAQTIETMQGHPLKVNYINGLDNLTYANFNILADQTLMMNGFPTNGDIQRDPYTGPIPMVVHLHGGEMPSNSDGGPTAWFMPSNYVGVSRLPMSGTTAFGPGYAAETSSVSTYPNQQEGTTLWYHPHDQGLTRINVYTGLAGYYFLRGTNEDKMKLPGWRTLTLGSDVITASDDMVREVTPDPNATINPIPNYKGIPRTTTFNSAAAPATLFGSYLPEIELAIQDRMFNQNGELYWPVTPTNPDIHPFWTPEFFGDVMTVNGKSWPYLSVAPRKYTFRLLDGCNARFLNLWLEELTAQGAKIGNGTMGPKITIVATEGGFMDAAVDIAPGQKLLIAPAERPIIIIDFSGLSGHVFTLRNDARFPYPTGIPPTEGLDDRIMQFVVNGTTVQATAGVASSPEVPVTIGVDKTFGTYLRPTPLVQLADFTAAAAGTAAIVPVVATHVTVKRRLILNEIANNSATPGGPVIVSINNSHFDIDPTTGNTASNFGGPTEIPTEGTTEVWQILNTTVDAHPMHIHLTQWQLVSRQIFDKDKYLADYAAAWHAEHPLVLNWPSTQAYPGGAGSPFPYLSVIDGAIGGNPAVNPLYLGDIFPALPQERGWKDAIKAYPGEISTYICRMTPTDIAATETDPTKLIYSFDPSFGSGYVWHCHIIDHEDMDMMRPMPLLPNPARKAVMVDQPVNKNACTLDPATFTVSASLIDLENIISYQWQVKIGTNGAWNNIVEAVAPLTSPYTNSKTATLSIYPAVIGLTGNQYKCVLTNHAGITTSNPATLTVTNCTISGTLTYNNTALSPLKDMTVTANGKSAIVDAAGLYTIRGVTSGLQTVTVKPSSAYYVGSVNSTDAGAVNYNSVNDLTIQHVNLLAGDVTNNGSIGSNDAQAIQNYFVSGTSFARSLWSFWNAASTVSSQANNVTTTITVNVDGVSIPNFNLLGLATGDFNGSLNPLAAKSANANLQLNSVETLKIGANQEIELPIRSALAMEVGAVSLILNIPSDLVEVKDVYMKGSNDEVSYKVNGNELRIGWNSLKPVNLQAAGDLLVLKLKTTSAFTEAKTAKIKLVSSPLNEIANGSLNVIPEAMLNADVLIGINDKPGSIALSVYPNPFSANSTLSYTLPADASVTVKIYNLLGVVVKSLVNEHKSAGTYTVPLDASKMPQGTYTAILRIDNNNKIVERTVKIVVNK